ncbi:MAG: c-type cytochrome [Alphaproteobacteria bacterium]|nr:c-type cytochrome [Rhodospirillales bacterium]MCW9046258.1 c-type cytochrome [Alphaproteobacteria bacterium]
MKNYFTAISALLFTGINFISASPASAENPIYQSQLQRINSYIFMPEEPKTFRIAAYEGVFSVAQDGLATRISKNTGALVEVAQHPNKPNLLIGSGFKGKSEKLGVLRSSDGGKSWTKISDGDGKTVVFTAIDFSQSNSDVVYGAEPEMLQKSKDGGETWTTIGNFPAPMFDLAVSVDNPSTIYAATQKGLFVSHDSGKKWVSEYAEDKPVTMILVTSKGKRYAFVYQVGLVVSERGSSKWETISSEFGGRALMEFAISPTEPKLWLAAADTGAGFISQDQGKTWKSYEGHLNATAERIGRGEKIYEDNCQACHGVKGVGEKPEDPGAVDEDGLFLAPALNDDAHGWHHPDTQLIDTILNGSPRNERMLPWKDNGLSKNDAQDVVAYMKSLWSFRSLACQGPRHMSCMR